MKLIYLSPKFYSDYTNCPEILMKVNRPYACLSITINKITFAIPFRHHIAHKYAFFTNGSFGLDYTKAVAITDPLYISPHPARINQKEFNAIKGKERAIARGMERYIKLYKKAIENGGNSYANISKFSALQYFEDIL